jgi:hypothetical protein
VQHQSRIGADQPRGINAQSQVGADAGLAVACERALGIAFVPGGFHLDSVVVSLRFRSSIVAKASLNSRSIKCCFTSI